MSVRLTLLCHASTSATNVAGFPGDEGLDDRGSALAADARGRFSRARRVLCGPALACRQTAATLELDAEVDPALRDWHLGRWRGQTLDQVSAAEPDAVQTWLREPAEAPHGGEPLTDLLARVGDWLATVPADGHTVAVTHPSVVRAAVVATVSAAPSGFWRIDVAPLSLTVLGGGPGRWTLRATGQPLVPRQVSPRRDPTAR